MVCLPCFIVPVLLWLWHKFVQPYVLKFWNPWEVKDEQGNVVETEFPFNCVGGVCKFSGKKNNEIVKPDVTEKKTLLTPEECELKTKAD